MLSTVRDTLNYVRNLRSKVAQIFLKKQQHKITCCTLSMASRVDKGRLVFNTVEVGDDRGSL